MADKESPRRVVRITGTAEAMADLAAHEQKLRESMKPLVDESARKLVEGLKPLDASAKKLRGLMSGLNSLDSLASGRELDRLFEQERKRKVQLERATLAVADATQQLVAIAQSQADVLRALEQDQRQAARQARRHAWVNHVLTGLGVTAAVVAAVFTVLVFMR